MTRSFKPKSFQRLFSSSTSTSQKLTSSKWVTSKTPSYQLENPIHPHLNSLTHTQRHPNYEYSLISALKLCSTHLGISQGRQIHCLVLKSGLDSNTFIQNSLINLYTKCGFLVDAKVIFGSSNVLDPVACHIMLGGYLKLGKFYDAQKLFDLMPVKACVAYTTMILGFCREDHWNEAIQVFKDMMNAGVVPTEVTMGSVISACYQVGGIWDCRMLHGLVVKMMLCEFVIVSTNLLHMYCGCSSMAEARALFDVMEEKNLVSWNVMLNGYAKAGLVDLAREVFERIPDVDVVSWATIIDGYVGVDKLNDAISMFRTMVSTGFRPNEVMMVDLVSACSKKVAAVEGQQLHCVVVKAGFDGYGFVQATIIHFYASCGRIKEACMQFEVGINDYVPSCNALIAGFVRNGMIDQARKLFHDMPEKDVFSWSTIISGYAQCDHPHMAFKLFHDMVGSGIRPNEVTMVSVFSAIAALGTLKEGRWVHEYVITNSIPLNDNLIAAIIDMYAKCGSINTALEVFNQIRDKASTVSPWNTIICGLAMHGREIMALEIYLDLLMRPIKLSAITFIGVLNACCHAGLVDLGKKYFKSMKNDHDIDPDIRHYGCMVDLLGRAGRLEEAEEMIGSMPMRADVIMWGTLLAACKTHGNVDIGERAANNLARLEPSHGGSRILLSNLYADAGRWNDALSIRRTMQSHKMKRLPGYSGATL